MTVWSRFRLRVLAILKRTQMEGEMDAELRFHIEAYAEDLQRNGMPREQAVRHARIAFGGIERAKEECRDARGSNLVENFIQDLHFGLRTLGKDPGFTAIAVTTLALGIALNATMFSLVSAFLLRRQPAREPERVAVISSIDPAGGFHADASLVSAPNYLVWRDANHAFAEMAAADEFRTVSLLVPGQDGTKGPAGRPEALRAAAVSPGYFSVLGASAKTGRTFSYGEDLPGAAHVAVLSEGLWEEKFGSELSLIGRSVRLNRESYTVIGVMPASFRFMGYTPQLWIPLELSPADRTAAAHKDRSFHLYARLKPGVTIEQARAEFVTLARHAEEDFPETEKGWGVTVRTLPDFLVYDFGIRSALVVLMATVGFVLMMACANVAGLLLARSAGRRKELAIRISLGAGRLRIVRQLLTEGLVIALFGGAIGLVLAYWGVGFMRANMTFNEAVSAVPISLDWNVLWFALAVSVASAVLCGLVPALQASRTDVNTSLKDESRAASASRAHNRLRTILVTGEIAMALFLLVGTGLLIRGLFLIAHQNLGIQADHLMTAGVTLDQAQYKDASQQTAFVRDALFRLHQIPSVEEVAATSDLPCSGPSSVTFLVKGQPELPANQRLKTLDIVVTPEYFRAARIPLLHGHVFTEMDNAATPGVALVNQEFVHLHLHDQEPLGKQIRLDVIGAAPEWREIVGVVGNVKSYSASTRDEPNVYEPFFQRPLSSFSLMVRASSDPDSLASAMRSTVAQLDAELPLAQVISMPALLERQLAGDPFFERILAIFAFLALILAAIGIYGLIAYSVGQRSHEIGIRMALGAGRSQVLGMVLWQGMKMTAFGAVVGIVMALPLPKLFAAIFYELPVYEPHLYFLVPSATALVAMLATYFPARRATRVDPMVALRYE